VVPLPLEVVGVLDPPPELPPLEPQAAAAMLNRATTTMGASRLRTRRGDEVVRFMSISLLFHCRHRSHRQIDSCNDRFPQTQKAIPPPEGAVVVVTCFGGAVVVVTAGAVVAVGDDEDVGDVSEVGTEVEAGMVVTTAVVGELAGFAVTTTDHVPQGSESLLPRTCRVESSTKK
jgi:hypothetical protein